MGCIRFRWCHGPRSQSSSSKPQMLRVSNRLPCLSLHVFGPADFYCVKVVTLLHALIRSVLSQVLSHVASYAGCAALFGVGQAMAFTPLSVLSMIGMAFVMSFNFMALHETVHRSAFKSRMWNDVFMHVSGFFTMRPVCS